MSVRIPFPDHIIHEGHFITLTPLDVERDVEELFSISHLDEPTRQLWRYLPIGPFENVEEYAAFLHDWKSQAHVLAYVVRDSQTRQCLGSISLMCIRPTHGVAELGNIWYAPAAQRTKANTEANYLLLKHCFALGYRRMEWKCNSLNEPSKRAAQRLGFTYEGTFRQHMLVKGENRDTAWFSMLDLEWQDRRAKLERWLYDESSPPLSELQTSQAHV
jgi:RimJ/RimL family protein N-acetyltransferase